MSRADTDTLVTIVPFIFGATAVYSVQEVILPTVPNVSKTESLVMELLRVRWIFDVVSSGSASQKAGGFLSFNTVRESNEVANNTKIIEDVIETANFAFATTSTEFTTSGSRTYQPDITVDLTDGKGNGLVLATRKLDVVIGRQGGTNNDGMRAELFYKLKRIKNTTFTAILGQQLSNV